MIMKSKNTIEKIEIPDAITASIKVKSGIILTSAFLNGKRRQFIIDSGAPGIILNSKYTEKDNTSEEKDFKGIGGGGVSFSKMINEFRWKDFKITNRKVSVIDFTHLEAALKEKIYGLIGFKELSLFTFNIDYKAQKINLWKNFNSKQKNVKSSMDFILFHHLPVLEFTCGNVPLKFALDTGASNNVVDVSFRKKLKGKYKEGKSASVHGANKGSQKVSQIYIDSISSKLITLKKVHAVLHDLSHVKQGSAEIDGLLGYEFLRKGKFAVSYSASKIYLLK